MLLPALVLTLALHTNPAPSPWAFFMAVLTPTNFEVVFTAFCRIASHVRPSEAHFVSQLLPAPDFIQLTSATHGGLEVTSYQCPSAQTHEEGDVEAFGLDTSNAPHNAQMEYVLLVALLLYVPLGQSMTQRLVVGSHAFPSASQSDAVVGQRVEVSSPGVVQQQKRA